MVTYTGIYNECYRLSIQEYLHKRSKFMHVKVIEISHIK